MAKASQSRSEWIAELLQASSRTFALTIPMLPEPLRDQVGLAYLILRSADGIEDGTQVASEKRLELLARFSEALAQKPQDDRFFEDCRDFATYLPQGGERDVVASTQRLLETLEAFPAPHQAAIRKHCIRVVDRMGGWIAASSGGDGQRLKDLGELSDYMYSVAGIVGELLTDLFVLHNPRAPRLQLMARAADFGAGLQLTNIIRDAAEDADMDRHFLPTEFFFVGSENGTTQLQALVDLARLRLATAVDYTCGLPEEESGVRLFCLAPVVLALSTLEALMLRAPEAIAGERISIDRLVLLQRIQEARDAVNCNDEVRTLCARLDSAVVEAGAS